MASQYNDTLSRQTRLLRCGVLRMQNFMGASAFTCILAALQPTKPVVVRGEIPIVGKPLTRFYEMHCLSDAARPLSVPAPSHVSAQSRTFSSSRVRRPHIVSNSKTEDGGRSAAYARCSQLPESMAIQRFRCLARAAVDPDSALPLAWWLAAARSI